MVNFNKKELYELLKESTLYTPRGTRSLIYKYEREKLIKINRLLHGYVMGYDEFLRCIELLKVKKNREEIEETVKMLTQLKSKVLLTTLPLEMVYVDDLYVGTIINFFEGYKEIDKYNFKNIDELMDVSYKVIDRNQELIDNGIYTLDLTGGNILVKDGLPELIDLDDETTLYLKRKSDRLVHCSYDTYLYLLKGLICQTCLSNNIPYVHMDYPKDLILNYDIFKVILNNYHEKVLKLKLTK